MVGVEVTNGGRASFHVARWALRSEPGGISFTTLGAMTGSATIRTDIAPGASAMFYTDLNDAYALASAAKAVDGKPQRIVVTVESGGRVYTTKPIASANVALGAPSGQPGQPLPLTTRDATELRRRYGARKLFAVRDLEVVASELRLIAAGRRTVAELGAPMPRIDPADELLDEWIDASRQRGM